MKKKASHFFLILFALLIFLLAYFLWVKNDMSDFGVTYKGGQRILKGETLYRTSDGHLQFKYSPASAVFFSLFSFVPYEIAKFVWYLFVLFFLIIILNISYNLLPSKNLKKGLIISLSFLILLKFIAREVELGQVNIFIYLVLILLLQATLVKKDIQGGLFWGFSLFFKPYALVFLPYFILKKRFKLIAVGIGLLMVGLFTPTVFYGLKGNMAVFYDWKQTLSKSTPSLLATYDNASVHALFLNVLPDNDGTLSMIFIGCTFLILGLSLLWMMYQGKRKAIRHPEVLEFSFLLVLIPFLSPLGWYYNYLYSLLAITLLLNSIKDFSNILRYILVINFVVIGASLREILGKEIFRFYTQYSLVVINYVIVLFFLLYARLKSYS